MASQFQFLSAEWPEIFIAAGKAEFNVYPDPRTSCFYARRTLELVTFWLYQADRSLTIPYQDTLSARLHEPAFRRLVGEALHAKARLIKDLGNLAAHGTTRIQQTDALAATQELFHLCFWLARAYSRQPSSRPAPTLSLQPNLLPKSAPLPPQTAAQIKKLAEELALKDAKVSTIEIELARLREEVAAAKQANEAEPDAHDYSEAQTRDFFIDLLLKEAGWPLDQSRDREFPISGMPNAAGAGFVDYVLWGDDGRPLALIEAKRTRRSPTEGQQQAKLYADCLERQFSQRPVIFYSNGYEHWLWDDRNYPPRTVQGFFKKDELERLIQRRASRQSLSSAPIDPAIVERYYQTRAIRRIGEALESDQARRTLLVMATGAGKTRTVIALADLLMRCNWVMRVLFLADRVALVKQAENAFKTHLPAAAPVNLVQDKRGQGRVYLSTYPTMMGLIDDTEDGFRRFGPGHFDLIVIDEAHRSVYQRYGAIFDYFDSLLVGLTATPREEVGHDTYRLFQLEKGIPTDAYDIADAVQDKFLVPARAVSVPLRFQREGIRYDDLSEEERERWDALDWSEEETAAPPREVDPQAVNNWLFNQDTVDKVLEHLMTQGEKVERGDKLGKTIIFAKNQDHADFIARRFDANYPHYKGAFARVITFKTEYAQSLIDDFSRPDKWPQIAISVDMLDTGIDVPDVLNLVFFKLVRSKTKFWQMVGRGTRLRPNLYGPGKHKSFFYIFDYCQNLEYFQQNPEASDGASAEPLAKRLFSLRVELIAELDAQKQQQPLRKDIAEILRLEVAAMPLDNFLVRPKRRYVEKYAGEAAWGQLGLPEQMELLREVAGLPSAAADPDLEAKLFDLLILRLQLARLRSEKSFTGLRERIEEIANLLSEMESIPMVREQMPLILSLLSDDYWQDLTPLEMENVRKKLRPLIKLIEKTRRKPIYSDFEDEIGIGQELQLPGFENSNFERFREKARAFLRSHTEEPAIRRLRANERLTGQDLSALERLLKQIGSPAELAQAKQASEGFGLFLRSLVGLDRAAAKSAFDNFLAGKAPTANQIEFIDLVVNCLTEQGYLDPARLYESPFTDMSPLGVEGLFPPNQTTELIAILSDIRNRASAAAAA